VLTLFALPKAFRGTIGVIQSNAIRSWLILGSECEVILLGDDEGTAQICSELGIRHIPNVERNEYGTPLVSSIFEIGQHAAMHQIVCYLNADIILLDDFLPAIRQVQRHRFLLTGQRWDLEIKEPVNFDRPDWAARLRTSAIQHGQLHPPSGFDYFVFPVGLFQNVPPLAIGRGGWDNWLLYRARAMKAPVIDATQMITAIHQNHDYSHHPQGTVGVWQGPERDRNVKLMGGTDNGFSLEYATLLLTPKGLHMASTPLHLYFRMRAVPALHPRLHFLLRPFRLFEKLVMTARRVLKRHRKPADAHR